MADKRSIRGRSRSLRRGTSVSGKSKVNLFLALRAAHSSIGFPVGRAVRETSDQRKSQDAAFHHASLGFKVIPLGYDFTVLTPLEKNMRRLASLLGTKPQPGQAYVYYKTLNTTSSTASQDKELLVKRTMAIEVMFVQEGRVIELDNADLFIDREKVRLTIKGMFPVIDSIKVTQTQITITLVESPPVGAIGILTVPFYGGPISFDMDSAGKFYFMNTIVLSRKDKVPQDKFIPGSRLPFPCFDDSRLRAPLFVTVGRPPGSISVSNAPLVATTKMLNEKERKDWFWDTFSLTAPVNVEELTFIVSNNFKVYTPMIQGTSTRLVTEKSRDSTYYEETVMPYFPEVFRQMEMSLRLTYAPMPTVLVMATSPEFVSMLPEFGASKLGVIYASPRNFGTKGLKPGEDPLIETFKTLSSMTRWETETWFTCGISGDSKPTSWLHRSLANFLSYQVISSIAPNVHRANHFDIAITEIALREDDRMPCDVCVWHPHHAWRYEYELGRGIAVLITMKKLFGDDVFWRSANQYLVLYWLSSVQSPAAFLKCLHEVAVTSNVSLQKLPQNENVPGLYQEFFKPLDRLVPVVFATRNYQDKTVVFAQRAMKATSAVHSKSKCEHDPLKNATSAKNKTWTFPLALASAKNHQFNTKEVFHWLRSKETEPLPHSAEEKEFIMVNPNRLAYARVHYDEKNWRMIAKSLELDSTIPERSRAVLYSDAMYFYSKRLLVPDIAKSIADSCVTDNSEYCRLVGGLYYDVISALIPDVARSKEASLKRVINEVKPEIDQWLGDKLVSDFAFNVLPE